MEILHYAVEPLLTEKDVAKIIGLSLATVRRWRMTKKGPRFLRIGASVRYHADDVKAFLEAQPVGGAR